MLLEVNHPGNRTLSMSGFDITNKLFCVQKTQHFPQKMTVEPSNSETEVASQPKKSSKRLNIVLQCAAKGDAARLQDCFSKEDDPYHERVEGQLNSRDDGGRSPVEIACTEGHMEILKLLIEKVISHGILQIFGLRELKLNNA